MPADSQNEYHRDSRSEVGPDGARSKIRLVPTALAVEVGGGIWIFFLSPIISILRDMA